MSAIIQFILTEAGQTALWNANSTGVDLDLTHIQFGSGNRVKDGTEIELVAPEQAVAFAGGSRPSPTQIRMSAIFTGMSAYEIREIGIWAGDPGQPGSVLAFYWSQAAGAIAAKFPNIDFIFTHDMVVESAAAESLNIIVDPSQNAALLLIAAHEAKEDPHQQYIKVAQKAAADGVATLGGDGLVPLNQLPPAIATDAELAASLAAHIDPAGNPHQQYMTQAEVDARLLAGRARRHYFANL